MLRTSSPERFTQPSRWWRLRPLQLVVIDLHDWLFTWVVINLLWLFASLTIILLPAATAALFATAYAAYRNQPPAPRRFLADIRRWFAPSWLWAGANILITGGLLLAGRTLASAEVLVAIAGVLTVMFTLSQFFLWAYMMFQEQPKLLRAWRNSAFTVLGDLPYFALYLALTLFILIPSVIVIAPFLLITPVLLALLTTYGLAAWLERHRLLQGETRDL